MACHVDASSTSSTSHQLSFSTQMHVCLREWHLLKEITLSVFKALKGAWLSVRSLAIDKSKTWKSIYVLLGQREGLRIQALSI